MQRLSDWIQRISTGWVVLSTLIIFIVFTTLVLPAQASQAKTASRGAASPDTSFYYSAVDLYQMAEAYGEAGRLAYIRARFTFDLVWPLVYLAFLATGISWIYRPSFPPGSLWQMANLVPLLATSLDYLENLSTSLVMRRYPSLTPVVNNLAGIFTLLKWIFVFGSFALLLAGLVVAIWLRISSKVSHKG